MKRDAQCLVLLAAGHPGAEEARRLVRSALGEDRDWGALEIEAFPGRDATLLLAHPAAGTYISKDAARFLWVRLGRG